MALTATIYTFEIDLADADRGRYETLALRVPRHPSESGEYLVTRVLAYCLEHTDGIAFSNGLSDPDEPTLAARDLTGTLTLWVEIGAPDAARLHRASKAARRVAVYTHKDPDQLLRQWTGERIYRADDLAIYSFSPTFITAVTARLDRRMSFALSVADGHLMVAFADAVVEGDVRRHVLL